MISDSRSDAPEATPEHIHEGPAPVADDQSGGMDDPRDSDFEGDVDQAPEASPETVDPGGGLDEVPVSEADARARERFDSGIDTPGGRAFYADDDPTRDAATRLVEFPGTRTYDLHGSTDSVTISGEQLGPLELGAVIRADPDWHREPITLFSCDTGKVPADGGDPFAQKLADDLGVPVTAPTELAWSAGDGSYFSAAGTTDEYGDFVPAAPDGRFELFMPREAGDR